MRALLHSSRVQTAAIVWAAETLCTGGKRTTIALKKKDSSTSSWAPEDLVRLIKLQIGKKNWDPQSLVQGLLTMPT